MTDPMTSSMTEAALFELLSLECLVDSDGTVCYYNTQGQLHRVYGPAVVSPSGYRAWYQNGKLHRPDGPAIEYSDGGRAWYINGIKLTRAKWKKAVASMETV